MAFGTKLGLTGITPVAAGGGAAGLDTGGSAGKAAYDAYMKTQTGAVGQAVAGAVPWSAATQQTGARDMATVANNSASMWDNAWGGTDAQKAAGAAVGRAAGARYNASYDASIGDMDKKIGELQQYASSGGGLSPDQQKQLAELQTARAYANAQRWQSTLNGTGEKGAGYTALITAINTGKLTWDEVGKSVDISALDDDVALKGTITSLLAAKEAAASPAAPETSATPAVDDSIKREMDAAAGALAENWNGVGDFVNSQTQGGTAGFDKRLAEQGAGLTSAAGGFGRKLGAAAGSAIQGSAGSELAAKGHASRDALQQDIKTMTNERMTQLLKDNVTDNAALSNLSTEQKLQVQQFAAQKFVDTVQQHISEAGQGASDEVVKLADSIKAWQTAEAGSEQKDALWQQIVSMGVGLASRAAVAAAV